MKVLFVIDSIHCGGISTSLMPLLSQLSRYAACDLLVFDPDGAEKFHRIPEGVHLLKTNWLLRLMACTDEALNRRPLIRLFRWLLGKWTRLFGLESARRMAFGFAPRQKGYDAAVAYRQDEKDRLCPGINDYVRYRVKARLKLTYFHADMEETRYYNGRPGRRREFDYILCVSEGCREHFVRFCPHLQERVTVCENFVDTDSIQAKAAVPFAYPADKFILFTACRLCPAKAMPRALRAMDRLAEREDFLWYIAGDGPEREEIEAIIAGSAFLSRHVILLGYAENPFPYMAGADVFFLPSRHEASPVVLKEARVLGIPLLTTDCCGARELVEEPGAGLVCENSEEGIRDALERVLGDKTLLRQFRRAPGENAVNRSAEAQMQAMLRLLEERLTPQREKNRAE